MKNIFKSVVAANMLFAAGFGAIDLHAQGSLNLSVSGSLNGDQGGFNYSGYVYNSTYTVGVVNQSTIAAGANVIQIELVLPPSMEFLPSYPGLPTGWSYVLGLTPQSVKLINTTAVLTTLATNEVTAQANFNVPVKTVGATPATGSSFGWGVTPTTIATFNGWSIPTNGGNQSSGIVIIGNSPLPVLFKDFTVTAEGCKAVLNWSTAVEKNNSHFEIERSQNGTDFRSIGSTNGAGTSFEVNSYTYVDEKPENLTNFYRIRQVDFDKKSTTSTVENAKFDCKVSGISVYPNPTSDVVYVKGLTDKGSIKIYNMVGQLVIDKKVENSLEGINMSSLAEGTYQIQVFSGDKSVFNTKLIKR